MSGESTLRWDAPEPGLWSFDPVHTDHPATGFAARHGRSSFTAPFDAGMAKVGSAMGGPQFVMVNGWFFGTRPSAPAEVLADREAAAIEMIATRGWREEGRRWFEEERGAVHARCRALQEQDLAALSDTALADHLTEALSVQDQTSSHHFMHIPLTFVIGELVLACGSWGVGADEALDLLAGASPASSAPAAKLAAIAAALHDAGCRPASLDDVRSASPEAAAALDTYLDEYGARVSSGFDVDDLTLAEMPEVILTSILAALDQPFVAPSAEARIAEIRARVPADERERFDELLDDARFVYGIRDDDVGPWMWARGLTRLTILEAAHRLAARGAIADGADLFEAGPDEIRGLLTGSSEPPASELAARAALRREQAKLTPPAVIGAGSPSAAPANLPPTVARVTRALSAYMSPPASASAGEGLRGYGIGREKHTGRARVAHRAEEAFAKLEPGDVLVTAMTTPAFNGILPIAGALVVRDAGLMSHASIMARELGIPAVLGVARALEAIADGALVEVDPAEGLVRVLDQ